MCRVAFRLNARAAIYARVMKYLDGLRWYSWIGSLLQISRQVLIHVLKDQSESGFSVGPRDCAYIKQPKNRKAYMREGR